jgi:hypothetical protein
MKEDTSIAKEVVKGLTSIIFPPSKIGEKPSEYIELHYCEKCKKYHKAE